MGWLKWTRTCCHGPAQSARSSGVIKVMPGEIVVKVERTSSWRMPSAAEVRPFATVTR